MNYKEAREYINGLELSDEMNLQAISTLLGDLVTLSRILSLSMLQEQTVRVHLYLISLQFSEVQDTELENIHHLQPLKSLRQFR